MSKLGEYLKAEREKQGISIQEISMALKISTRVLTAMETGDKKALPARTFVRGFVKTYAIHLQLDPQAALHLFNDEYGLPPVPENLGGVAGTGAVLKTQDSKQEQKQDSKTEASVPTAAPTAPPPTPPASTQPAPAKDFNNTKPKEVYVAPKPKTGPKESRHENKFMYGAGIVLAIGLLIGIVKVVTKYQNERVVTTNTNLDAVALPPPAADPLPDSPSDAEGGPTSSSATGSSASETAAAESKPAVPTNTPTLTAGTPVSPLPATASPTPSKAINLTPTPKVAEVAPTPAPTPAATSTAVLAEPLEVIVEASGPLELKYTIGVNPTKVANLAAGELVTIRARNPMSLQINDGGKASLIINGIIRNKSPEGQPLSLRLPE